jgi:hypothetical protein
MDIKIIHMDIYILHMAIKMLHMAFKMHHMDIIIVQISQIISHRIIKAFIHCKILLFIKTIVKVILL